MAPKGTKRRRHIPQRTCVGCRSVLAKRELIRLVRTPEGVQMDQTGKQAGRGAYLHNQRSCWEQGIKTGLERALKTTLSPDDKERLTQYMLSLPEDSSELD
jgi:predicted RNA-binding protein YlxR (DUF448 family)